MTTTPTIDGLGAARPRVAVLHGGGYVGGLLVELLTGHPHVELAAVTSRAFAGRPVWAAHPHLRGQLEHVFAAPPDVDAAGWDAVLVAAEHGQGAAAVKALLEAGFDGAVVDLSADFRLQDRAVHAEWYGLVHAAPELLEHFTYGLPELFAPYPTPFVANPGCFATGLILALHPLALHLPGLAAAVTAFTGASGSGTRPSATTHYPTRDGNVRAYRALRHRHLPEVQQALGADVDVAFVPVSGPWTRGIWGTAHVALPAGTTAAEVAAWYADAYAGAACVRLWPGELPELRWSVGTPCCDVGFVVDGARLVVGFALDNLLKGAAGQAVQNLNLLLGLPETAGLLPAPATPIPA